VVINWQLIRESTPDIVKLYGKIVVIRSEVIWKLARINETISSEDENQGTLGPVSFRWLLG